MLTSLNGYIYSLKSLIPPPVISAYVEDSYLFLCASGSKIGGLKYRKWHNNIMGKIFTSLVIAIAMIALVTPFAPPSNADSYTIDSETTSQLLMMCCPLPVAGFLFGLMGCILGSFIPILGNILGGIAGCIFGCLCCGPLVYCAGLKSFGQ